MRILVPVFALLFILLPNIAGTKMDIHSMVIGSKVLELSDTRQITFADDGIVGEASLSPNGKYIAFTLLHNEDHNSRRLCIVKSSGGRLTVLMDGSQAAVEKKRKQDPNCEVWQPVSLAAEPTGSSWSPDSSMFVFQATRQTPEPEGEREESWLLVTGTNGGIHTSFKMPDNSYLCGSVLWAPDGRSICFPLSTYTTNTEGIRDKRCSILRINISNGDAQEIISHTGWMGTVRWVPDGKTIEYMVRNKRKMELHEIGLDGSSDRVISDDYKYTGTESADGRYIATLNESGISLLNLQTQDRSEVVKDKDAEFCCWHPSSKMFVYSKKYTVTDEQSGRKQQYDQLWLSSINGTKYGRMCIAMGFNPHIKLSWSADCTKIAYIYRDRLHLAELSWRDTDASEKAAAGLPLTEEEEKEVLQERAKRIGMGLKMYMADWDDCYPSQETFRDGINPYLQRASDEEDGWFLRPGTDKDIFKYFPQGYEGDIANASETITGVFDPGTGWFIELYADGHVTTRDK